MNSEKAKKNQAQSRYPFAAAEFTLVFTSWDRPFSGPNCTTKTFVPLASVSSGVLKDISTDGLVIQYGLLSFEIRQYEQGTEVNSACNELKS